jgi:hypothetical protein
VKGEREGDAVLADAEVRVKRVLMESMGVANVTQRIPEAERRKKPSGR